MQIQKLTRQMRFGIQLFPLMLLVLLMPLSASAKKMDLLAEMQVADTCGTIYADKLASCSPFQCQKPSPMAMMMGTIPQDALEKMSQQKRAEMKARMKSTFEIKGLDAQGICHTSAMTIPEQRMDCAWDKNKLQGVSDYTRIAAKTDHIQVEISSHLVEGKMISDSTETLDGKEMVNPMMNALKNGQCEILIKDTDAGWISNNQLNRMAHIELNLSEHGKHVDGHIQILNSNSGKVLFDMNVETSQSMRKFNLPPGTFDIKVMSKNPQLAPVWFHKIKLDEAHVFTRDVEFYAITGTLKLTVNIDGKPSKGVAIYMTDPESGKWIYHGVGFNEHKPVFSFIPANIKLPETLTGSYQVYVTAVPKGFTPATDAKYESFKLTIKNGDTVEKTINISETPIPSDKVNKESTNTLFILDASGSMWGQIKGKAKITIAKEVMAKLVPELPANSRIGLVAYGHRRKGDCNDVETLVKLGANNQLAVLNAVQELNAKGKTPLTSSVNQAFKMLQNEAQSSTIILVSDGIESCNGDPCATVKAAKKYGVKFILHTVGFGLSKGESAQLKCMADAGGGQYFAAKDAEQLLKSVRKAVQSVGIIKLTAKVNGTVVNLLYHIEDAKTGKIIQQPVLPTPSGFPIRVAAGQYNVFVLPAGVNGASAQKLAMTIKGGEVIKKTLTFGKGVLHLTVTVNGKPVHAHIHVEDSVTHSGVYESSVFGWDTPLNIDLAAGTVDIVVQTGGSEIREQRVDGIKIVTDKTTELVVPIEAKLIVPDYAMHLGSGQWTAWDSSEGPMGLLDADEGKYVGFFKQKHGRLLLHRDGINVTGFWVQDTSNHACTSERDGSRYWGRIEWKFDTEFNSFSGTWSYCDAKPAAKNWSGNRSQVKSVITHTQGGEQAVNNGMEQNTDRPGGGDYHHFIPDTDDPALCQKACQEDEQCKSWTYVKPNTVQGPSPNCWLKQSVPTAQRDRCCVSGTKSAK